MYNYVKKLRDPSHVKALSFAELLKMFKEIGLTIINTDSYGVEMDLERLLPTKFVGCSLKMYKTTLLE